MATATVTMRCAGISTVLGFASFLRLPIALSTTSWSKHFLKHGPTSSRCTLKTPWWARLLWLNMYFLGLLPRTVVRTSEIWAMCRRIMFVFDISKTFDHNINIYHTRIYYGTDTSVLSFYTPCRKPERTQACMHWVQHCSDRILLWISTKSTQIEPRWREKK